jgi:excisionase family DNA binding protein
VADRHNGDQDLPRVLTVPEAAAVLRISRGQAYRAVKTGEIPSISVGKRVMVPTARLLALLGEEDA